MNSRILLNKRIGPKTHKGYEGKGSLRWTSFVAFAQTFMRDILGNIEGDKKSGVPSKSGGGREGS